MRLLLTRSYRIRAFSLAALILAVLFAIKAAPTAAQAKPFTVYLGFDDGPDAGKTPLILDILKKYNVKATFFIEGAHIAGHEAILRREWQEGHHIGNHLISHELEVMAQNKPKKEVLLSRWEATELAINAALGGELAVEYNKAEPIKPFRWPGGAVTAFPRADTITYNWNVSVGDDVAGGITPKQGVYNVLYGYPPHHYYGIFAWGDGAVVLLHDESITTVRALPVIIKNLQAHGVTFGTLPRPGDTAGTMPIQIGAVPACAHQPGNCEHEYKFLVDFGYLK
ncbi:MAG: polysaccharide deacetylase family protein [Chloroflexota bacterium]